MFPETKPIENDSFKKKRFKKDRKYRSLVREKQVFIRLRAFSMLMESTKDKTTNVVGPKYHGG